MLFKRNIPQQVTAAPRAVLPSTPQRTGGTTAMTNVSSDNNGATDAQATKDDAQGAKVNQIAICVEERL